MSELNDDERADLISYLDGEMDEEMAQAFEARLGRDPQLRAEADAMKKTWELLDYLPRPEPSASFTHQTLERLAIRDTGRVGVNGMPTQRWAWAAPVGWAAAMLMAMGGGLFAAHHLWPPAPAPVIQAQPGPQTPDTETLIVRDLDVIQNKRLYDQAPDLDFVRALPGALGDDEGGD
jgi:anti-sigma factor RsiW